MSLTLNLIVLFLSSVSLNFYLLYNKVDNSNSFIQSECPKNLNQTGENRTEIIINCTEQAVNFIVNDYFSRGDDRFELQQKNFTPKDFFPIMEYNETTGKELFNLNNFYTRHVSFNYPFVLRGGAKKWRAIRKWTNDTYLLQKIGNLSIYTEKKPQGSNEFAYFKNDFQKRRMKYKKFLELSNNYVKEPYIYYWAEQEIPKILLKDVKEPKFGSLFNLEEINIWQVFIYNIYIFNKNLLNMLFLGFSWNYKPSSYRCTR